MALYSIINKISDLNEPLYNEELPNLLVSGDSDGDRFDITVVRGSEKVSLVGATVTAYFIRIPDGSKITDKLDTVVFNGTVSDNIASVILPQSCYTANGRFSLVVKAKSGTEISTLYVCTGAIFKSTTDSIVDPGHYIPDLNDVIAYADQVQQAIDKANEATKKIEGITVEAEPSDTVKVEQSLVDGALHLKFFIPNYSGEGTVEEANRLSNPRTIKLEGDVTGETQFDGSADVTIQTTSTISFDYEEITDVEVEGIWNE